MGTVNFLAAAAGLGHCLSQWEAHRTTRFPEVHHVDMRGADCSARSSATCALPALWFELLYDR